MGFTIATYSLYGLPPLSNIYVSIHGTFQIRKDINCYVIIYTVYYHAMINMPVITQKDMCFSIDSLPQPTDLYTVIYNNIKQQLNTNGDLVFVDDL